MFSTIPENLLPYLIGFPVFMLFGFRGLRNYQRLHNPLSKLFAYSGFAAGIAFGSWSIPFFFPITEPIMIAVSIFGDFFLYAMFALQAYIVYYLALKNRIPAVFIVLPFSVLAFLGWLANCYGYIYNGVSVENGKFLYSLPAFSDFAQLVLLINVFIVGILMVGRIGQQTNARAKGALMGIGALYLLTGFAGTLNVILSGDPNGSPLIVAGYVVGFVSFVIILATIRLVQRPNKKKR